ncbi:MAG: heme-binding domain-containing protein [Bacteroidetes bacterium]|nr:heme-binding domain-containing protein [Bacteroidota bacterium]
MKKVLKYALLVIVVGLVVCQFIGPDKTNPAIEEGADLLSVENVPANVVDILKTSCYDCHSNETVWPWYTSIAPLSWGIINHVNDGREELNFSTWKSYKEGKKLHKLEECIEMVAKGYMPIEGYVKMHDGAELTDEEKVALKGWIKERLGDYVGEHHVD